MASHLRRPRPTGADMTMSQDLVYGGQEQNLVERRGGDGGVRSAAVPAEGDEAGLGASQDGSGSASKEWNPFFSCTGEDKDPARVVVIKTTAAARRPKVSAAGQALSRKPSKALEGLLPRAFAKPAAASRKHKKAVQEGDDNAEVAFSVPPSVKAALTRCAAQSRERVARASTAAAGGGRGLRNAHLAASARSGGCRSSPVTPSLTPYATEHTASTNSTVSASSENGNKCHFFTTANANGGEGNDDAGGGGGGGLASGKGDSSPGEKRNGDAGVAVCDVHAEENNSSSEGGSGVAASSVDTAAGFVGGSGEEVDGRRNCHANETPTGDEPLHGRPSERHEPIGSWDVDKLLTKMLAAEGGDENRPAADERRDNLCIGSGDVRCVSTSCDKDVGGDFCAKSSPGSAGGIAAAAVTTDNDGDGGNGQRQLWKFSPVPTPTMGVSISDLEAAFACAEKAPPTKKSSQVLVGMSDKSKAVSKVVMSPFRRRGKSTTP